MSDNWVVSTLEDALNNWNNKLAEIWSLVSQTPESFRGGFAVRRERDLAVGGGALPVRRGMSEQIDGFHELCILSYVINVRYAPSCRGFGSFAPPAAMAR